MAKAATSTRLASSLVTDDNDANRRRWAQRFADGKLPVQDILPVLRQGGRAALRCSWMLGGIVDLSPSVLLPLLPTLFRERGSYAILQFERSLAKMFWKCGFPASIEGEAVDALFTWLRDPQSQVSIKVYSMYALMEACKRHPDLRQELLLSLEAQKHITLPSWKVAVRKVHEGLGV